MKNMLKDAARVIAFDDGSFKPKTRGKALLVGVIYRLDNAVDGLLSTHIEIDGLDSTEKIIDCISHSRFSEQISAIMLSGISFAGFNIADINEINSRLKVPVIVVSRKKPDFKKIFTALSKFKDCDKRISLIKNAGDPIKCGKIFFQVRGEMPEKASILIRKCTLHSEVPEPIRLSHIIASGISTGESKR